MIFLELYPRVFGGRPNTEERGRSALPGLVEQELCRLSLWALSQQLFWVCWAAWI